MIARAALELFLLGIIAAGAIRSAPEFVRIWPDD
jgi:hypothetical protein